MAVGFGGAFPGGAGPIGGRVMFCLLLSLDTVTVIAHGAERSQPSVQPSANPPKLPPFSPAGPPEGFSLPTLPESPEAEPASRQTFAIRRVEIDGNTVLPEADVRERVAALQGRTVTLAEIEQTRQALTQLYIDRGYLNSGATIAADGFRNGVLSIKMAEGRLDEVRVAGQGGLRAGYLQNRLLRNADEPLHLPSVQERFQLLLADPLIRKLNGRILPGPEPGHAILDVQVTRARPYQLSVFGDNYRPPSIGAEAFGLSGWVRNLTGLGDILDFTFATGSGSDRYSGGWRLPLNDWGTEAYVHFDEGTSSVIEEPVKQLRIRSEVHALEGGLVHPLILSLKQRLGLGLSFAVRENETWVNNQPFSFIGGLESGRNQATVLRFSQDYLHRWDSDVLSLRSTLSFGLDALGATANHGRNVPSGEFFAWLGQAQYAHRFTEDGLQALLRGTVQLSDARLLPLEQMAVGGVGTVRGYRENQLVRDQGFVLSAELHVPVWRDAESNGRLDLVPFVDYGEAWNFAEKADSLTSVGIGFTADYRTAHAELYYGYGFDRPATPRRDDLQDHGIHFQGRIDAF